LGELKFESSALKANPALVKDKILLGEIGGIARSRTSKGERAHALGTDIHQVVRGIYGKAVYRQPKGMSRTKFVQQVEKGVISPRYRLDQKTWRRILDNPRLQPEQFAKFIDSMGCPIHPSRCKCP